MHILGIRHHGPGSARRLQKALEAIAPDCILVEMPLDVEKSLGHISNKKLKPPVALLVYNPGNFDQAVYLPFATFSPEWQALQYGARNKVPVRPVDLPVSQIFGLQAPGEALTLNLREAPSGEDRKIRNDPLSFLAELAGYSDSERWWDATLEQEGEDIAVFEAIQEMIRALRSELPREESRETILREAHMRKMIRKAHKDGFRRIVVVCGAWHAPALAETAGVKAADDNRLLRGLKKVKTENTWIPWSYDRLAKQAGYGAGVISPAWYDLLFNQRQEVTIRWISRAARLLRHLDLDASAAHVTEAVRLAEALATLRRRRIPGLEELEESVRSVLCGGDAGKMNVIREKLIIGDKIGKVPPEVPVVPLQKDLEKSIRAARLSRESQTHELLVKTLDLRKEANRLASLLLHRLNLLNIPWGKLRKGSRFKTGSFSEEWSLKWKPEFAIRIIEASALGNTVREAAAKALMDRASGTRDLAGLSLQVEEAIRADLREAIDPLILRMRDLAALTKDIEHLMSALPALVSVIAYGDTRQTDTEAVRQLVDEMIPRIGIGLPGSCLNIETAVAKDLFQGVLLVHQSITLLDDPSHLKTWFQALESVALRPEGHQLLRGGALRLLFDKGLVLPDAAATQFHYALSRGNDVNEAALWLEGFLQGSGLILIHNPALWSIVDDWVDSLSMEVFQEVLPILRRIFSDYPPAERRQMLEMVSRGKKAQNENADPSWDGNRVEKVLPTLKLLLGY